MKTKKVRKIALLGAGNLATHLGRKLAATGYKIIQVYSRTTASAEILAGQLGAGFTDRLSELDESAGTFLFCLPDAVIRSSLEQTYIKGQLLIHTSGSVHIDVFKNYSPLYAVLYPLQTISRGRDPDWINIPLCIEGNNQDALSMVSSLAEEISDRVISMDSSGRKQLHLSGVIASNFSNHMYSLAFELAGRYGLDPGLLSALIRETADKAIELGPAAAQTGPAFRDDGITMQEHIEMLKGIPEIQKLYTFVSESIRVLKSESDPPGN